MSLIYINPYSLAAAGIVTSGLALLLDAGNTASYPGTGTTWTDLSGNGNTGTLTNGPTYSSADGGSIVLDGTNDYINGVHDATLNLTGDVTVELWFRLTATVFNQDYIRIFGKGNNDNRTWSLWYHVGNQQFLYQRYGSTNMNAVYSATVSLNTWYHMVGTSSSNNHVLYLNGVSRATVSTGTTFASSTDPYTIGQGITNQYHIGNIAKAAVYNRGLSAAEVTQNFDALKGRYGL